MRILNRPMFRYGGPIREGVMHGMRNGGRAALVGNPVYPKTGGREHHNVLKTIFGLGAKPAAGIASKPGFIRTQAPKAWQKIKSIFGSTGQAPYNKVIPKQSPGGKILGLTPRYRPGGPGPNPADVGKVWTPKGWVARDPTWKMGKWGYETLTGPTAKTLGKKIVQGIATPTGIGLTLVGTKWLWPDGKEANEVEIKEHLNKSGTTSRWDDTAPELTESQRAKLAKEKQNERMKSYLDMMGYDSAKKTAMSDALIDASALVQDASTEAGSLKKADWGKLINKTIQATSKRLDKPEQIKEAVGLMATKAAIAKDMSAEENKLNNDYKRMQIALGEKTLAGTSFEEIISDRMIKGDMLKGNDLAALFRIKKGIDAKVISTAKMDADQDALSYVTKLIEEKEGTPYPPGYYIISDRIVKVDEQGVNKVL